MEPVTYVGIRVDDGEIVEGNTILNLKETGDVYIAPAGSKVWCYPDKNGNIEQVDGTFVKVHPDLLEVKKKGGD